jgi:hypothetical protein
MLVTNPKLVISSTFFILPCIQGIFYKKYVFATIMFLLTLTSVIQHTFLGRTQYLKWIDRFYAATLTIGLTYISLAHPLNTLSYVAGGCGLASTLLYICSKYSKYRLQLHLGVHLFGTIGFMLFFVSYKSKLS